MKRAILHIDGDSFFASCEVSLNPRLRGLPVVTGQERGIATAMSKEAKALGISRGMPIYQIKKLYPQVVIRSSSYSNYELFSQRMFAIVRRFTPYVEEYSIDECFADLSGFSALHGGSYESLARELKDALQRELHMTFSLGVAPTKVLAKVASSKNKPDGLTILELEDVSSFLKDLEVGRVWGIGPATSRELNNRGIRTALDLARMPAGQGRESLSKNTFEIYQELRGAPVFRVHTGAHEDAKSIQATRTFTPPSTDKEFIFSELSKNIENACVKARREGLSARRVYYFLKTQEFRYHRMELPLDSATSSPASIVSLARSTFDDVYRTHTPYRTSGVTLAGLVPQELVQNDLFGLSSQNERWGSLLSTIDGIDKRYGSHTVVLGSSLRAFKRRGGAVHKHLRIPYIGEAL